MNKASVILVWVGFILGIQGMDMEEVTAEMDIEGVGIKPKKLLTLDEMQLKDNTTFDFCSVTLPTLSGSTIYENVNTKTMGDFSPFPVEVLGNIFAQEWLIKQL